MGIEQANSEWAMAVPPDFAIRYSLSALSSLDGGSTRRPDQFTILNFVRLNSWSIAKYSSISGLSGIRKGRGVRCPFVAALFAHTACVGWGRVYHIRLCMLAHRVQAGWDNCFTWSDAYQED
jgi:hypothetical protein